VSDGVALTEDGDRFAGIISSLELTNFRFTAGGDCFKGELLLLVPFLIVLFFGDVIMSFVDLVISAWSCKGEFLGVDFSFSCFCGEHFTGVFSSLAGLRGGASSRTGEALFCLMLLEIFRGDSTLRVDDVF